MYPLLPGLMKQDPDHRGPGKRRFNYILSRCRMAVECAFVRLKSSSLSLSLGLLCSVDIPYDPVHQTLNRLMANKVK